MDISLVWRGASGTRADPNLYLGGKRAGGRSCTDEGVLRQEGVWPKQSGGGGADRDSAQDEKKVIDWIWRE